MEEQRKSIHEHSSHTSPAEHGNALANAASSYLRSAMHQPVQWQEWGEAAFALAREQNKPILLDIGAVWCHWCHVMDRESYEDAEIAEIINSHFVAVKVDRDERLDVDTRYQSAVSAMSGQGGWPLTVILTPEGKPFFGGTYFPKEERYGRPGFGRVLLTMAHAYHERKDEVLESADSVMAAIEYNESFSGRSADLHGGIVEKLVLSALQQFDKNYGGFGTQPKFPHPAILDLLLDHATRTGDESTRHVVRMTLDRMASGGMYDHLAGGFHRYSVDERWVVPHFEKMLYDNSELLKNYVHSFQSFVEPEHARVAREIILWMDTVLSDRERGGFYASQDADDSLDDDGDYFTWTQAEAAAVLTPQELEVAGTYFDIGEMGDMHHNPQKNTLHIDLSMTEVARRAAVSVEQAEALLDSARRKMYAARLKRPTPYVDKTVYVNWNGLAISAYLEAARFESGGRARVCTTLAGSYPARVLARGRESASRSGVCRRAAACETSTGNAGRLRHAGAGLRGCVGSDCRSSLLSPRGKYCGHLDCALSRCDRRRIFRHRAKRFSRHRAGRPGGASETIAGLADTGGKFSGRRAVVAFGNVERTRGLDRESGRHAGSVRRGGGTVWTFRWRVWPGAATLPATAGAGLRDRRR